MRIYWLPMLLVVVVGIILDVVIARSLRRCRKPLRSVWVFHAVVAVAAQVAAVGIVAWSLLPSHHDGSGTATAMRVLWCYFLLYAPKAVWALLYTLHHPVRRHPVPRGIAKGVALTAAAATLGTMLLGTFGTPYTTTVTRTTVACPTLPQGFDGYKIVLVSDLHLGTYEGDTTIVSDWVETIDTLDPDLIVMAGDMVNSSADELEPYVACLRRLEAHDGVLAVLGNHDYHDYSPCSTAQWQHDLDMLCSTYADMGWTLLRNSGMVLHRSGDSIAVVGTENYGTGQRHDYSRLDSALATTPQAAFTMLLQHNPEMWRAQVVGKHDIGLTLSGHTHAMQCMVTIGQHRMSPARLRFDEWGGLYTIGNQHLYVSTGLGMVGVPARIGATPEIALITLSSHLLDNNSKSSQVNL